LCWLAGANTARSYSQHSNDISDARQPINAIGCGMVWANFLTAAGTVGNHAVLEAARI